MVDDATIDRVDAPPGGEDLLTLLHRGPLETPPWQAFLSRLQSHVGAEFCGMFFRQGDAHITDSTEISAGDPQLEDLMPQYKAGFHALDPVPYDSLAPGRVHALGEFIEPGNPLHARYLHEFLIPGRRQFQRIMRVTAPGGYNAVLVIWRGETDFSGDVDALLAGFAPHLAISLQLYSVIERERVHAGICGEAVRRLNFGWLRLDARGHVLDRDAQADHLLRHGDALRMGPGGRLQLRSAEASRRLNEALRDFASDPLARPRAVRLSDEPWLDMLLRPAGDHVLSGPARPVVTAYLHGDRQTGVSRIDQFVHLFGLTASEARLALAITRGRTIAEAAAELGISEQTARGYSKIAYGKTGARGQADLVRILLTSAASLA
ncbi:helix-turn-helix transcriptional regulator [Novosphingobium sp. FKTRR1]|uniref:helix-turn-helix transcriptional regulator n=1 Tax=Novosphingobium sp. FKTRR1 TaxID=2879118 RepID=UPI001CF05479|nr:helix-turn-helix transcriptional regulator [Novosphingobium sp. FKTRR1]